MMEYCLRAKIVLMKNIKIGESDDNETHVKKISEKIINELLVSNEILFELINGFINCKIIHRTAHSVNGSM